IHLFFQNCKKKEGVRSLFFGSVRLELDTLLPSCVPTRPQRGPGPRQAPPIRAGPLVYRTNTSKTQSSLSQLACSTVLVCVCPVLVCVSSACVCVQCLCVCP